MGNGTKMLSLGIICLLGAACGTSNNVPAAAQSDVEPVGDQAQQLYSETVVQMNKDGTQTVHVNHLTRAEVDARAAARAARAEGKLPVGPDNGVVSCNGNEQLLLGDLSCTGDNNVICFSGAGTYNMSDYCEIWHPPPVVFCEQYWAGNVQAWLPLGTGVTGAVAFNPACPGVCSLSCGHNNCEYDFSASQGCTDNDGRIIVDWALLNN